MNLKENKESLITMLCSEDGEIRRIALNIIKNNYITDFIFDSDNFEYTLHYSEHSFKISMKDILKGFISYNASRCGAETVINLIIEYNELKGRQRASN